MKEQFVTYEIALKLKELGFNEKCLARYSAVTVNYAIINELNPNNCLLIGNGGVNDLKAPLWQQCLDWFREAHNLQVEILWRGDMSMFCYKIGRFRYASHEFSEVDYRQFEEAREQAILKALELIK